MACVLVALAIGGGALVLLSNHHRLLKARAGTQTTPDRPFTARVADALVEPLAGELPTAQAPAPADEHPGRASGRPRRATRRRPREHSAPRSAGQDEDMANRIHTEGLRSRTRALAAAALAGGMLVAGCGGSSGSPTTAGGTQHLGVDPRSRRHDLNRVDHQHGRRPARTRPRQRPAAPGRSHSPSCMRANGVPNFRDPSPEADSSSIPAGTDHRRARFQAAQAKCQKLMGGGPPGPGTGRTHLTDAGEAARDRECVCASTAFPSSPTLGPPSRPTRPRHPGDHRLRRSDPSVPDHDQPCSRPHTNRP